MYAQRLGGVNLTRRTLRGLSNEEVPSSMHRLARGHVRDQIPTAPAGIEAARAMGPSRGVGLVSVICRQAARQWQ